MSRLQPHSSPQYIRTIWLILLIAALGLILVTSLLPPAVVWATPPQQGTTPATVPGQRPPSPPGIPEPATITLVGLGIGALAGYAWRRRRADEKSPKE